MSSADIVNEWYRERLCCGALARDTEAYNQVVAAIPDLIGRLDAVAPAPNAVPAAAVSLNNTPEEGAAEGAGAAALTPAAAPLADHPFTAA